MTEITGTSKTGALVVKFDLKTVYIYILFTEINKSNKQYGTWFEKYF